jgi:uncharacterized membrane protein YedE/YeeE
METVTFWGSVKEEGTADYVSLFEKEWPPWVGGILLAFIAVIMVLWDQPWGIAAGYRNWAEWLFYLTNLYGERPISPLLHTTSVMNIGLLVGALASALISRQFAIRGASRREYVKGLVGGLLMGTGAALARGCNVGGFYSAIGMLSMGGFAMMVGLVIGAYIGLRYWIWELNNLPEKAVSTPEQTRKDRKKIDWKKVQPYLGILLVILVPVAFQVYAGLYYTKIGGLLFFGFLIGVVMHRSRFCFCRAFRCPFMTGDASVAKAVALSIFIYAFGVLFIKWRGIQPDMMGVYQPFWIGSLIGGVIFGIGMLLAGGCGSGTLWRTAEGHTKLWVALVAFAVSNFLTYIFLIQTDLLTKLGKGIFIPDVFTWQLTLPILAGILILWYLVTAWNEKTDRFVVF